ncbi:NADPH:quinone oxidoreductase family protein [Pseudooceanicola sp.]|uniref:NADPH:quinone oxidoreductase family protein n=1 Tax=Pseudooceanicola sp. TaxID=1914328 RepID=UPI0040582468
MKALLSTRPGGPETLGLADVQLPEPAEGEVRIRVRAAGINFPDLLIIEDKYQFRPERPFAPGAEFAGEVSAIGPGVSAFAVGDRVMAMGLWGGLAEEACAKATQCFALPDGVDLDSAAALQFTYGTALYALRDRGALAPGETLLVLGAAGGVGLAAVQLGRQLGARVIAAVSSDDKLAAALEAGAEDGVVYPSGRLDRDAQKALSAALRDKSGPGGADVIFDTVGGDYGEPALRVAAWLGRYLVVGFPAGIPSIPANLPLLKSCDVRGVFWGAAMERDPAAYAATMRELVDLLEQGAIRPRIHARFPLSEGAKAIAELSTRAVRGKVIVTMP